MFRATITAIRVAIKPPKAITIEPKSIVLRSLSDADSKPIATPIAINATEEERSLPLSGILFRATITAIRVAIKPPKAITIAPKSIVLRSLSDTDSKPIATPIAINATEEERSLPLSGILFRATITAIRVAIKPPKAITIAPKSIVLRSLSDTDSKPIATPIAINATEEEASLPLSGIFFIATMSITIAAATATKETTKAGAGIFDRINKEAANIPMEIASFCIVSTLRLFCQASMDSRTVSNIPPIPSLIFPFLISEMRPRKSLIHLKITAAPPMLAPANNLSNIPPKSNPENKFDIASEIP